MSELDRKLRHLEMLKRTLSETERRIAVMEKEIDRAMLPSNAEGSDS